MNQQEAESKLQLRLFLWAQKLIAIEVAEGFPALHECDFNRRVKCFLAWMKELGEEKHLPVCLSLVRKAFHQRTDGKSEDFSEADENMSELWHAMASHYHHSLLPTIDSDSYSPNLIKADIQRCRDAIIEELGPIYGKPRKRQAQKLWYRQNFGEWVFLTHIEISRISGPKVDCYSFLWRSDFERKTFPEIRIYADDWSVRLDPLVMTGISSSSFSLIGQSHEKLVARSVRASIQMLLPSIPKLVDGLGIND